MMEKAIRDMKARHERIHKSIDESAKRNREIVEIGMDKILKVVVPVLVVGFVLFMGLVPIALIAGALKLSVN